MYLFLGLGLLVGINNSAQGQGSQTYTTPGTYTFTIPAGVTNITIQAWGGGASGGAKNDDARGGGGGGGYVTNTYSPVSPGQTITIIVGAGGIITNPSLEPGVSGGSSSYNYNSIGVVTAGGGQITVADNGGAGGTISGAFGPGSKAGGNGANRVGKDTQGGGGGGSGPTSTNAAGQTGGSPNGGNGGNVNQSGQNGTAPGGGGGGKGDGPVATYRSGNGANGQVIVSWSCSGTTAVPVIITAPICAGTTIISGTSESGALITVYSGAVLIGTGTATGTSWTLSVSPAFIAGNIITAKATAPGKCISNASAPVTVTNSTATPVITTTAICAGTTTLSGTSESGATVSIYAGSTLIGTGTAVGTIWTVTVSPAFIAGEIITATASSAGKCVSLASSPLTVIIIPSSVTASASQNPICTGSNLTLTGTATDATIWSWTGPNGFSSSLQNAVITNITTASAGDYSLIAGNACGSASVVTVSVAVNETPTFTTTKTNVLCNGGSSGSITVTAIGGTGPYQFSKNGGTDYISGSSPYTFSGLSAGNYNIKVKDANGCTSGTLAVTITQPPVVTATITPSATVITAGTSGVTYTTSAGMTGYTWSLSGGGTITAGSGTNVITVTWNTPGNYTVSVQYINSQGCLATGTLAVTVQPSGTFAAGAYIIDMGQATQTIANGLKPYGLVYQLFQINIPVYWAIKSDKGKDGIDFNAVTAANGNKAYKGGSFVIAAENVNASVTSLITTWKAKGVIVDGPTTASFSPPIYKTLTEWPKAFLDAENDVRITPYYTNAEIPTSSYHINSNPLDLPPCGSVSGDLALYVLPHADPDEWPETWIENLRNFINNGGSMWAGCHAVSVMENLPGCNFLSNGGLVPFKSHAKGSPPYTYLNHSDPVMQFIGTMDNAVTNGSEDIYVPKAAGWRSSTVISIYDPNFVGYPYPNAASIIVYGPAFGTRGMIMYEASHDLNQEGTVAERVAAQRAYFNFLLISAAESLQNGTGPTIANAGPDQTLCGGTVALLAANTPAVGIGTWSIISGPSTLLSQFSNTGDPAATFTPAGGIGDYSLRWTIANGTCVTESDMMLTMRSAQAPPIIGTVTQPTCAVGSGSVSFTGLPSAGWTIDPLGVSGTGSGITLTGIASGTYAFTVTNLDGCTSPAASEVIINAAPQTPNIADQTISILSGEAFSITPEGVPAGTTYTWTTPVYTGGVTGGSAQAVPQSSISGILTIPVGSGTATYTVTPTSGPCTGATFKVIVTVTSECVPVSIVTQPDDIEYCAGEVAGSFTVEVAGTSPMTFQWQYRSGGTWSNVTDNTPTGAIYTDAATATLHVNGITTPGSYEYQCIISNCSGVSSISSESAILIVHALPNTSAIYHR